jgi:hypothetical protein
VVAIPALGRISRLRGWREWLKPDDHRRSQARRNAELITSLVSFVSFVVADSSERQQAAELSHAAALQQGGLEPLWTVGRIER